MNYMERVQEMTLEEVLERRIEIRHQLEDLKRHHEDLLRAEKLRHEQALNDVYTDHRENLARIDREHSNLTLPLRDEMDALSQWRKEEGGAQ